MPPPADPAPPRTALFVEHHLAQAGRLSQYLAHELNNQLAGIMGYAQLLLQKPEAAPVAKQVERILKSSERAQELIANFHEATQQRAEAQPVSLGQEVDTAVRARSFQFTKRNVMLDVQCADRLPIHTLNPTLVQLILGALLDNALEALLPTGGRVTVTVQPNGHGGTVVEIADSGEGPPHPAPLWTTSKEPHRHAGIGLTVATWAAEAVGSECEVASGADGRPVLRWDVPASSADAGASS